MTTIKIITVIMTIMIITAIMATVAATVGIAMIVIKPLPYFIYCFWFLA